MRISEIQQLIERLIIENMVDISDLIEDAKKLAMELMRESNFNAEYIIQYFEGALLEIFILATILQIDIEKLLETSLARIISRRMGPLAE